MQRRRLSRTQSAIHVLLRREGWEINGMRVNRLYKEMGLQLRRKALKRGVKAKLREGRCAAPESMVSGPWTSSMTIWRRDRSCAS
jgi:hypothetical protein